MDKINVLYTVDHKYVKYMLVSLYSLLENNADIDVIVHIIYDNLDIEDYKIITRIINTFNNANVYFYDFKNMSNLIDKYNIPKWRGTNIANARIFFSSLVKNADKLLYLDSDTVIVDSLSGLNNYNGTVNMVQDSMPTSHWQNLDISLEKYCNSGVIWIDTEKWKEKECDRKIINVLESGVSYTYPDQDLLNMALKDDIELLPPEYDLFSTDAYYNPFFLYKFYKKMGIERYSIEEMKQAKKNPIILHATPFYQWRAWEENKIHPYNKYYDKYLYNIFGKINKEKGIEQLNPTLYKLYSYLNLIDENNYTDKVKRLAKEIYKKIK